MLRFRWLEVLVGMFMLAGLVGFFILALQVSGYSGFSTSAGYLVSAEFDNIGDLRVRAPVTIAGVKVGEVAAITLNPVSLRAKVQIRFEQMFAQIPFDSSAQILTQGLLGSNYIGLTPGFEEDEFLQQGGVISETHPALILENLIGQFLFSMNNKDDEKQKATVKAATQINN